MINPTGINTTFIFTEDHIKNTLIPNFSKLIANTKGDKDVSMLSEFDQKQVLGWTLQIANWKSIIAWNDLNRSVEKAKFDKNITFSAGAARSYEMTSNTVTSSSFEYHDLVNLDFATGAKIENDIGFWAETDFGAVAKFRWSNNTNVGKESEEYRTVGYVLNDNDIGDYFSVDVMTDSAFSVPAFRLRSGASSCPYEPGSQHRDLGTISVNPLERNEVPADGIANFIVTLGNESETQETRDYRIKSIQLLILTEQLSVWVVSRLTTVLLFLLLTLNWKLL